MSRIQSLFMEQQESEEFRRYLAENEPMEYPPDYQAHLDKQPPKDYVEWYKPEDEEFKDTDKPVF